MRTEGWLATRTGRDLLREEVRHVRRALDGIFGDHFIQLGVWGDAGLFRRLARTRRYAVVAGQPGLGADLVSAGDELAIAGDSVDAVLLPHTLELADDPHDVLREVDRILRPDGHLVVLGFNPLGWWGARHFLSRREFPPDTRRLISEGRLQDWLRLLDFKVHHQSFYYYVPPIIRGAPRRLARDGEVPRRVVPSGESVWSRLGPLRRWSAFASCYITVARKELFLVTPIRQSWRRRTALAGALVNPTTRNAA